MKVPTEYIIICANNYSEEYGETDNVVVDGDKTMMVNRKLRDAYISAVNHEDRIYTARLIAAYEAWVCQP